MNILFIILKILGILLLVILFFVLLLLVHPLFYKVKAEVESEISIKGHIWWLFQILRLEFEIEEDKKEIYLRIFGFRKKLLSESEDLQEDVASEETAVTLQEEESMGQAESEDRQEFSFKQENQKSGKTRLKCKWIEFNKFFETLKREFTDMRNRMAVSHIWKEFKYLLSHLKPKYVKGDISFSTGDPAATGEVTGMLSLLPVIYQYDARIYPDFLSEDIYIRGTLAFKGQIALWHISCCLIRLIRDKNMKRLVQKFRN